MQDRNPRHHEEAGIMAAFVARKPLITWGVLFRADEVWNRVRNYFLCAPPVGQGIIDFIWVYALAFKLP